jgi:violaxanthin de-epoxidase
MAAALLVGSTVLTAAPPAALALDGAKIGTCLIQKCTAPLARCVGDPTCLANLACIQTCTGRPDEGDCQIKCGDEFTNDVVGSFTACAVSKTQCVPQRPDDNSWPVPMDSALVKKFSPEALEGKWYISAGLNKAFDAFDCQLHDFSTPAPNKLVGNLQWRIKDPVAGTNFVTRYVVQEFVQDENNPAILYNHDNEFLHYQDDWYVLAEKPQQYVLIYYRGTNDAWDGYGGAVVYSREPVLDKKYYAEIDAALSKIGRKFSEFTLTDNSCRAAETKLEELEADLQLVESRVAGGIQTAARGIEKSVENEVLELEREAIDVERAIEVEVKDLLAPGKPRPLKVR